ncbi:MAG: hypothetical protein ACTSVZ_08930 [Promethearchaeota archaeon]
MMGNFGFGLKKIISVFSGQKSKEFYFQWYLINCTMFILANALSSYLYPTVYSIVVNHVSNLGGYGSNPQGALIWNISLGLVAVGNFPLFMYLNRESSALLNILQSIKSSSNSSSNLSDHSNLPISPSKLISFNRWWKYIGYLGLVGMVGVAIFPEEMGILHILPALMAFFGQILWLNWLGVVINCSHRYFNLYNEVKVIQSHKPDQPKRQNSASFPLSGSSSDKLKFLQLKIPVPISQFSHLVLGILDISFIIALFFSMGDIPYHGTSPIVAIILDFPLWEWISFCFIFLTLGFFVRTIPSLSHPAPSS